MATPLQRARRRGALVRTPRQAVFRRLLAALASVCALTATAAACASAPVTTSSPARVLESIATTPTAPDGLPRSIPTQVRIPKIGVDSDLMSLGLNKDGTIEVPPLTEPMRAGWYRLGPTPGEVGPAVILGHVDGNGQKGVFYDLKNLSPGDEIEVSREDGVTAHFRVDHVSQVSKSEFPTDEVYGNTPNPQLRLITCGGELDRAAHSYLDNIIVFAYLA